MTTDLYDEYEEYESRMTRSSRQARRQRKPRIDPKNRQQKHEDVVAELADEAAGLEGGFETTYQPSKYEAGWLLESLRTLYDQQFITDVLAQVKGGKEASVYCCEGHPSTGVALLAAKVYRPRMFRQLRNDHVYRQGRQVLSADGPAINAADFREQRALAKGTGFGRKLQHTSWLMHEYTVLQDLYDEGAAVPKPYASGENVILMSYVGDEQQAAPPLSSVRLGPDEVRPLFNEIMCTVEAMLRHGWVHGDLSAYNVLYWEGHAVVIDFPQVANIHSNVSAYDILKRDLTRICDYFAAQGMRTDPDGLLDRLWEHYAGRTPLEIAEELALFSDVEREEAALNADDED